MNNALCPKCGRYHQEGICWKVAPGTQPAQVNALDAIRAAVTEHLLAYDRRQHGGVADRQLVDAVQRILNMPWVQGAALAALAAHTPPEASEDQCPSPS